jgi:hypothetical protein
MTPYILPTDIEFARKFLAASRPDDVIVAALVHRGVESASATQLVADLRAGRAVASQIPAELGISSRHHSRSRRAGHRSEPPPAEAPPSSRPERAAEPPPGGRKNNSTLLLIAAVPICFAAVIIGMLISNHLRRAGEESQPDKPPTAASAHGATSPAALSQNLPRTGAPDQATVGKPSSAGEKPTAAGISNAPAPQAH